MPGKPPTLGRRVVAKASSKQFKATVAMSEDFPMKVDMLLAVLEVIAPQFKHFNKLRDFVKLKLPPGILKMAELRFLNSLSRIPNPSQHSCTPHCVSKGDFHGFQLGRRGGEFMFIEFAVVYGRQGI